MPTADCFASSSYSDSILVNVRMVLGRRQTPVSTRRARDSVLAVAPPSVAALQPDIAGSAPTTALHDIREQISRLADTVALMQARSTPEERQRLCARSIKAALS
ncbi:hypothetical protein HPB50_025405 [Hyalomma asiaticum]|uniref:Uncharacterized protein n=1 Tax=Hyalomma asiaticum TaxID=266040 RepID=A0ACB7TQU3_HYAAI|nr:hypothetical protein HPB50_025405 [Hyalomma asiaticum]